MTVAKGRRKYVRYQDHSGHKFGRLTVISFADSDGPKDARRRFLCRCECGNQLVIPAKHFVSGNKSSCGCLRAEIARVARPPKTFSLHPSEYRCWTAMIQRCTNPKSAAYPRYGGRGIRVCDRWRESFEAFYADMGPRPSAQHTIERKNNSLGYEPDNCVWATRAEQALNTRANRRISAFGITLCLVEWSRLTGTKRTTISRRLNAGWPPERAVLE